jgi:hypothetical protein
MVDNFALGLTHVLMALAFWRLVLRDDIDRDPPQKSAEPEDTTGA